MHSTRVRLGTFAKGLWAWLKKPRLFWVMLAVLLVAGAAAFWPETTEARIRVTGWVLELFGLGTVAWGLEQTRSEFGRPSFFTNSRAWWNERPRLRGRVVSAAGHASIGAFRGSARGQTLYTPSSNQTLEERVGALETQFQTMSMRIEQTQVDLNQEVSARKDALAEEREAREKEDATIKRKLETVETGGLHISMIGVVWLAAGLTLSTIPNELLSLWR